MSEEELKFFSHYCKIYYHHTLNIVDSMVFLKEESGLRLSSSTKVVTHDNSDIDVCTTVLEALNHQILLCSSPTLPFDIEAQKQKNEFLSKEATRQHWSVIQNCGLLHNMDWNRLDSIPIYAIERFTHHIRIRDDTRRTAHQLAATMRLEYVCKIVQKYFQKEDPISHLVTQRSYITTQRRKLNEFVSKFSPFLGSHSFLASLRTMAEKQLSLNQNDLILWSLDLTVLSECSFGGTENINNNMLMEYSHCAISLLQSFMMMYQDLEQIIDTEAPIQSHPIVQFIFHPFLSNHNIHLLLSDIPRAGQLSAKPTGTFLIVMDEKLKRSNKDGKLDDDYGWSYALRLCFIL